jgi:predicted ArsR family transcriptional regulator
MRALETYGFEPRALDDTIVLANCPFHSLARQHTELVCGMNRCLLDGLLDGIDATDVATRAEPAEGHCCVSLHPNAAS